MPNLEKVKYRALFFSLLVFVVVLSLLSNASQPRPVLHLYVSAIVLTLLMIFLTDRRFRVIGALIGLPSLLGIWVGYFIPGLSTLSVDVALHLLAVLFFCFTITMILRDIYSQTGITTDSVFGAFCGYFMVGLAFGHVFDIVELLVPNSFQGTEMIGTASVARHHILLTYFSFITLTTVGFGDITPHSDTARGLVLVEAILGQFYIAVLIAELIGKRVGQALRPDE